MARLVNKKLRSEGGSQKPLRYVLYVRKSSEGEDAQARSLKDQIDDCEAFADRENLLVIGKPIKETASAKASGNRPLFTRLLSDLSTGKYDGILSWHPDRLARNSLESGMIVDMLDSGVIKDLKFPTVQFTNDASGKLLLNILFAISKQYSEHLSETVQRGVDGNFVEGKSSGVHKWGYIRDEITGYYQPDPNYYDAIKYGWRMRIEGRTLDEIVNYWKNNDVHRMTKISSKNKRRKKITLSKKQMASNLFHDPFYYGILVQAGQEVDLRLVTNFQNMIDEDTYNAAQAMGQHRSRVVVGKKRATFYPLRNMVFCGVCDSSVSMRVGKNKSAGGKHTLSYRCDNKLCTRSIKSVRAKYIFDELYTVLEQMKFTDKEYKRYSKTIESYTDDKLQELRAEKRSLNGVLNHKKKELDAKARQVGALPLDTPARVRKTLIEDLEDLENAIIDLNDQLAIIGKKLIDPEKIKMTKNEFLNLANTVSDKMRAATPVEKDILARILLLNISLDNKNAPSFIWKEPFATLLDSKKVRFGGRGGT